MTDPTDGEAVVDEVVVTGQRRPANSPAGVPFNGRYSSPPGEMEEQYESADQPPQTVYDRCADPEEALDINADAAAADAAKEFARQAATAGEDGLNYRERGAFVIQRPDGSIGIGPIFQSDPFGPDGDNSSVSVALTYDGIDPSWIIGSVHSHPVGSHRPSGVRTDGTRGDLDHFAGLQNVMRASGRDASGARIYIVAQNQRGPNETPYNQINVYDETNIQASQDEFAIGPEVNPEGQPCP